jgi:hypothetical protein
VIRSEWDTLQKGDVIVERRTGVRRVILSVSRYKRKGQCLWRTSITLQKIVRAHPGAGPLCTYFNSDDNGRWKLER